MRNLVFKETCTHYTTQRDRYGDNKLSSVGTIACLYRDMTQMQDSNFREETSVTGIFWFPASANVVEKDLIGYNGKLYQIQQVINAKNLLTGNRTQFYKCGVTVYRGIS